ncbi:MAG: response regulator transcription factor [Vicinamibacterales bacterium]
MASTRPTVLVVEDEWLVAKHIQACLQSAGFDVPAPVHSARSAVEHALHSHPDVIVMDVKLDGDMDGISAAREIGRHRRTPIVYLTAHTDRDTVARAAEGYAASYILKPFVERQLISAVLLASHQSARMTAYADDAALEERLREIAASMRESHSRAATEETTLHDAARRLSPRERELVTMLAQGARLTGIARKLGLSTHTVRNHLKSIFRKLDVHSQHDLVEYWRSQPESRPH